MKDYIADYNLGVRLMTLNEAEGKLIRIAEACRHLSAHANEPESTDNTKEQRYDMFRWLVDTEENVRKIMYMTEMTTTLVVAGEQMSITYAELRVNNLLQSTSFLWQLHDSRSKLYDDMTPQLSELTTELALVRDRTYLLAPV